MSPCPGLNVSHRCVIDLTGANIRVTDVIRELTAGWKLNSDLHCNDI